MRNEKWKKQQNTQWKSNLEALPPLILSLLFAYFGRCFTTTNAIIFLSDLKGFWCLGRKKMDFQFLMLIFTFFSLFLSHTFSRQSITENVAKIKHRQRRIKNQGDSGGDRMFNSSSQRNVAKFDRASGYTHGNFWCHHSMYSSDMLCYVRGE